MILMTDDERLPNPIAVLDLLAPGSAVVVRARDPKVLANRAQTLREETRKRGQLLLIANDWRLAHRIHADGLHLSEESWRRGAPYWRNFRRPDWLVTAACHHMRFPDQIDAVLVSPVFTTPSHPKATALGALSFQRLAAACPWPVYPMGGVDQDNVRRLQGYAVPGIAGISLLAKK